MCDINPEHKENVGHGNGVNYYIYLCYRIFVDVLNRLCCGTSYTQKMFQKKVYRLNIYDHCVESNMIRGKQCIIACYVDDNKVSHVNPKLLDGLLEDM